MNMQAIVLKGFGGLEQFACGFAAEARLMTRGGDAVLGTGRVTRAEVEGLPQLVGVGRLRSAVGGTLPLPEAARAHVLMGSQQSRGRLVLTI